MHKPEVESLQPYAISGRCWCREKTDSSAGVPTYSSLAYIVVGLWVIMQRGLFLSNETQYAFERRICHIPRFEQINTPQTGGSQKVIMLKENQGNFIARYRFLYQILNTKQSSLPLLEQSPLALPQSTLSAQSGTLAHLPPGTGAGLAVADSPTST